MKKTKLLIVSTLAILLFASITNEAFGQCKQLKSADKQLKADLKMNASVWHEIINEGKIELINVPNRFLAWSKRIGNTRIFDRN
ncbi:MAG: hypothetical protein V3V00_07275 [Saprospiraceae bacterium]